MPVETIEGVVLDHVAHAVHRWQDVWGRYAVDLGGEWSSGGLSAGFAPAQLQFANGARVEVLMPNDTGVNDFLERFLSSNGPGPHHLTFKVRDLSSAIEQARRAGWEPIGIDLSHSDWMEAFIHPKQATGVVVQLAQAPAAWGSPAPHDYPSERRAHPDGTGPVAPASLLRVTHVSADMDVATGLFVDLLGGEVDGEGDQQGRRWVDLSWGGPLGLRLVAPDTASGGAALLAWLDGRPGRVHHLELQAEEPDGLPGARPVRPDEVESGLGTGSARRWVVEPQANAGMRLVLTRSDRGSDEGGHGRQPRGTPASKADSL